jgi:putative transcriptional regulator
MRHKLRMARQEKGITQTFIAKKLGYKTASGYNNIEMGRTKPSIEKAKKIADILGKSIDELFFDENFFDENLHKTSKSKIQTKKEVS